MRQRTHPGDILKSEYLDPLNITHEDAAFLLNWERGVLEEFLTGSTPLTHTMALNLSSVFETSYESWMGLEKNYQSTRSPPTV